MLIQFVYCSRKREDGQRGKTLINHVRSEQSKARLSSSRAETIHGLKENERSWTEKEGIAGWVLGQVENHGWSDRRLGRFLFPRLKL